ncbi:hypothetical protein POM88_027815 [Heracleum sosnowskyi]|uniref:Uncharacterized protein n=1 Tax=Heracleum sosnowskyi TaxID=360622 RepID=A0AAD8I9P4_9APIA|nr:hypothetical protein POM88_027815 [Heracleum sosnowskyi]
MCKYAAKLSSAQASTRPQANPTVRRLDFPDLTARFQHLEDVFTDMEEARKVSIKSSVVYILISCVTYFLSAFLVDNDVEEQGDEVPHVQPAHGFGMIENLPQRDINWPSLDTWSQDMELAHFDQGLTVEVSGYSEAVNLPDVVIGDGEGLEQWLQDWEVPEYEVDNVKGDKHSGLGLPPEDINCLAKSEGGGPKT